MNSNFDTMNYHTLVLLLLLIPALANARGEELTTPKLRELEKIPVGLVVLHLPNKVFATRGGPSGRPFTWVHSTRVASDMHVVTMKEFGAFVWADERWVFSTYTGKPFTATDFAEWYRCPGAKVKPGRPCADASNWEGGTELKGGKLTGDKARWYFIGILKNGTLVKGEAVVELMPSLAKQ